VAHAVDDDRAFLDSSPFVSLIEGSPFGVSVLLGKTPGAALDDLERQAARVWSRSSGGQGEEPITGTPTFVTPHGFLGRGRRDGDADFVVAGIPLDIGTTNRPGARFGPHAIRAASRMLVDGARRDYAALASCAGEAAGWARGPDPLRRARGHLAR